MTTKHTPGPWAVEYATNGPRFYSDELARQNPHSVNRPIFALDRDDQQTRDNARLIAAAPELLEGAEYILNMIARLERTNALRELLSGQDLAVMRNTRAAIAKATGDA